MKRLTEKQGLRAGEWIKTILNMEDWTVRLCVSVDAPSWAASVESISLGACKVATTMKHAVIWVNPSPSRNMYTGEDDPLHTLFHEFLHVFAADSGWEDNTDLNQRQAETAIDRLALVFVAAYRAKVKVP